jgi:hypothetical protein
MTHEDETDPSPLTTGAPTEVDEADCAEIREWTDCIFLAGYLGHEKVTEQYQGSAFNLLVSRLRAGKPIPGSVARALAELVDGSGKHRYRLSLVPVKKRIKQLEKEENSTKIALDVERIIQGGESASEAVVKLGEQLGLDARTIYRHRKRFEKACANGFPVIVNVSTDKN